ncbi:MAG: ribonuclease HI [Candidatus Desantisbacteria bacterium]
MKIAVSGKGGAGKTTLSAALAKCYAVDGARVLAVDADPDGNLASALGFPQELINKIVPISGMKRMIEERTGSSQNISGFFRLNPDVSDLLDRFEVIFNNIRFLSMGTIEKGAGGCMCPANVLLKNLMQHLLLDKDRDVLIMDMDAGIEHMGRATASCVDAFIVVVEPGQRSVQTAKSVEKLARDMGIKNTFVVCNKIRSSREYDVLVNSLQGLKILESISYSSYLLEADLMNKGVLDNQGLIEETMRIKKALNPDSLTKSASSSGNNICTLLLYTDGACRGNPGPGGWASILVTDEGEQEFSGGERNTTNNQMELMGVIQGLKAANVPSKIRIYSDSAYIINAFNHNWIKTWLANGWQTADKKSVKNQNLWQELLKLIQPHQVEWIKVKGHSGNKYNERCDRLAVAAVP